MCSHRQRFLNQLTTLKALLCRVAWINSDYLTTSTCSLVCQNAQKRAPRRIQNALCQSTARQPTDVQVFNYDRLIGGRISLGSLEMKISTLAFDLLMSLRHAAGHLTTATATLHTRTQAPLLAAQTGLTGAKEARVLDCLPIAISKEHLQAHVNTHRWPIVIGVR